MGTGLQLQCWVSPCSPVPAHCGRPRGLRSSAPACCWRWWPALTRWWGQRMALGETEWREGAQDPLPPGGRGVDPGRERGHRLSPNSRLSCHDDKCVWQMPLLIPHPPPWCPPPVRITTRQGCISCQWVGRMEGGAWVGRDPGWQEKATGLQTPCGPRGLLVGWEHILCACQAPVSCCLCFWSIL